MRTQRLQKLKSQKGETIAEVLIALLISSLALVMLASMISSTERIVTSSTKKMAEYYEVSNKLASLDPEGAEEEGITVEIKTSSGSFSAVHEDIPLFVNDELGDGVYAYGSTATGG